MKFDKIKPGMILYDVHSTKMGNTTVRTLGTWSVYVESVDPETRSAMVRWNGNKAQRYGERQLNKLKATKPILIRTSFGAYRRPTREELAQLRAQKESA